MPARRDDIGADAPSISASGRTATPHRGVAFGTLSVVFVIALQVVIPTLALLLPPPQKFGFQMYSGLGGVTVRVTDAEGVERDFDADQLVGKLRPEIDWLSTLPEAVCDAVPEAVRLHVEQSGRERSVECD